VSVAAKRNSNITEVVPFLRVADMPASIHFYVDGLNARIAARWEPDGELRWCRLELGGSALMLQTFGPGLRERASANQLGLGVSLAFQCRDAVALYHDLRSRGVAASEPFVGNGLWNTSVTDPDGYVLEFASLTDLPEETRLSDVQTF
jgi:catechol 2,3-dioxygenase-like lactoylglutathione lyase family enzyme